MNVGLPGVLFILDVCEHEGVQGFQQNVIVSSLKWEKNVIEPLYPKTKNKQTRFLFGEHAETYNQLL